MPTGSEAARSAATEAALWAGLSAAWDPDAHARLWDDLPGSERAVVAHHDPIEDLASRMRRWGYPAGAMDFADVTRFAAALAMEESRGWGYDQPHIATRAYESRRFLVADRLAHWAVPWLDAVMRCHPPERDLGERSREQLLDLAEALRIAPDLAGAEGRYPPGIDAYGPTDDSMSLAGSLMSIWSGGVLMSATLRSMTGDRTVSRADLDRLIGDENLCADLAHLYRAFGARWRSLAVDRPGSAELWATLAGRADRTAQRLDGTLGR